jgi:L-fucose isomerase-like protein
MYSIDMEPRHRVALVTFGEVNTPRELLEHKSQLARIGLESAGLTVASVGLVTDEPTTAAVERAVSKLKRTEFDLLVLCVAGWIPSQPVVTIADGFREQPMVLWGLSGATVDGRLVSTADQAGTTALRHPMMQLGFRFSYVYDRAGRIGEGAKRIAELTRAASAAKRLRTARIGSMGYRDMGLYATPLEPTLLRRVLGIEVETFELHEIAQSANAVDQDKVNETVEWIQRQWVFEQPLSDDDKTLEVGSRLFLAVQAKAVGRKYDAVTLIDCDGTKKLLAFPPGIVLALLSDLGGYAAIPENDIAGAVTQLIVRFLIGQVGAYFEFYEFLDDNRFLIGVPDFVPSEVVDGPLKVVPWPGFGGLRGGLLNVSSVKTGPVTLCRLGPHKDGLQLHVTTGTAHPPRAWAEAGWSAAAPQLPSLEIELAHDTLDAFAQRVLGQHYIVTYGDHRSSLTELSRLLGIALA